LERRVERNGDKTRIATLLDLLRQLEASIRSGGLSAEVLELEKEIAKHMERYTTKPVWRVDHRPDKLGRIATVHKWQAGASIEEAQILRCLEELFNAGKLITRCDMCGKWFCRGKRTYRFCSDACKRGHEESKEHRKARKRLLSRYSHWTGRYQDLRSKMSVAYDVEKNVLREKLATAKQRMDEARRALK
jgi:hypothetical protein